MNRNMMIAHEISSAIQEAAGQLSQVMPMLGSAFHMLSGRIITIANRAEDLEKHDFLMGRGPMARAMYARDKMEGISPPRSYKPHRLNSDFGDLVPPTETERRDELRPFLESIRCFLRAGGEMDFGTSSVTLNKGYLNLSGKVAHGAFNESINIPLYPSYNEPSASYISLWENADNCINVNAAGINYTYLRSDILMRFGEPCCPFVESIPQDSITKQLLTNELFLISKHKLSHPSFILKTESGDDSSRVQFIVEQPDEVTLSLRIVHRGNADDINGFKTHSRNWRAEVSDNVKWDDLPYYLQHLIADWLPGAISTQLEKYSDFLIEQLALDITSATE